MTLLLTLALLTPARADDLAVRVGLRIWKRKKVR